MANFILAQWTQCLVGRPPAYISHINNLNYLRLADKENQLTLTFIANNVSHKFEELQNDSHVNVSFLNPETTSWAS